METWSPGQGERERKGTILVHGPNKNRVLGINKLCFVCRNVIRSLYWGHMGALQSTRFYFCLKKYTSVPRVSKCLKNAKYCPLYNVFFFDFLISAILANQLWNFTRWTNIIQLFNDNEMWRILRTCLVGRNWKMSLAIPTAKLYSHFYLKRC